MMDFAHILNPLDKLSSKRKYFFMHKILTIIPFFLIWISSFSQTEKKVSTYFFTQYNKTFQDYTIGNNPWGVGLGLQTFFNTKTKFKPTIEFTGDIYLEDDKVFRSNPDGSFPEKGNDVRGMTNLFIGSSFYPKQRIYLSFVAGPSFISGEVFLGIKPSFGFYFSENKKWTGKISYINVFNRTKIVNEDFGSLSLGIGCKLF